MEILITGGNGLLGRHLVTALMTRGDEVRVLALADEDTSWLTQRGVAVYRGDIRRAGFLPAPCSKPTCQDQGCRVLFRCPRAKYNGQKPARRVKPAMSD